MSILNLLKNHKSFISVFTLFISIPIVLFAIKISGITKTDTKTVFQDQSDKPAVLASTTQSIKGSLGINIPAHFGDSVFLKNGVEVTGSATFRGDVIIDGQNLDIGAGSLTASNVLYSMTAGSGITLTTGQTPTITNSGVLSLGGKAGTLVLEAGSGIAVDGLKISSSITNPNTFKTVTVGSDSFSAGSSTDTLEFAAGSGVTLTTDTSNKKITITGGATSGWTDGGTNVYTTTLTDNVGIGTTTPSYLLDVNGIVNATALYVNGAPYVGSQWTTTGSNIYYNTGNVGIGTTNPSTFMLQVAGSIGPNADNLYNLGSSAFRFNTIYANSVIGATSGSQGYWQRNEQLLSPANITDDLSIGGSSTASALFHVTGSGSSAGNVNIKGSLTIGDSTSDIASFGARIGSTLEPSNGSLYDLGSSARRWSTVWGDTGNFTNIVTETLSVSGTTSNDFVVNSDNATTDTETSTLSFERGGPAVNAQLKWNATGTPSKLFTLNAPLLITQDSGITDSGTASLVINQIQNQDIFSASASGITKLILNNSGYLGLGTSPSYPLDLISTQTNQMRIGYDTSNYFLSSVSSTGAATFNAVGSGASFAFSNPVTLGIAGTSNGSLTFATTGAGEASPTITSNASGDLTLAASTGTVYIGSGTSGNITIDPDSGNFLVNLSSTGDFQIQDNGTNFAVFSNLGRFGLGSGMSSPSSLMEISGTVTGKTLAVFNETGGNNILTASASGVTRLVLNNNGYLGIGNTTPVGMLDVNGAVTGKAVAIVNTTGDQNLLTASLSGVTKFNVNNNGNLQLAGNTAYLSTITSAATGAQTYTLPDATGTFCLQNSANCGFATGTSFWNQSLGALSPINSTLDFLLGNTTTTSAKFAVLNMNSGIPTATISGNMIVMPNNGAGGRLGIGTITPSYSLDVAGNSHFTGDLIADSSINTRGGIVNLTSLNNALNVDKSLGANATSSWSTGTAGGTARYGHTSVVYNGKIYSWGGNGGSNLNTVDIYDIANNSWSTGTAGGTARVYATSVLYNGKMYIWGGNSTTLDIYDIANNSWSTGTAGGTSRSNHTSVLYNGKIYHWGGFNGTYLNTVDIYDIANNSWSTGTAGGTGRNTHTSVVYNGKMYSWGGEAGGPNLDTVDIYDIANNSWSTGTAGGTGRWAGPTSVLYNGKMYIWGGNSGGASNIVDIYDIAANTWSTGVAGGTARFYHTSVLYNGKMYSWGGSGPINTVNIYDIGFKQNILAVQENGQDTFTFQTGSQLYLANGRMGIMGGNVGIGTSAPSSTLDVSGSLGVRGVSGITSIASISGNTSFAGLVVNNNSIRGDLFTASSSGLNRFVIKNNGNVGIGTILPAAMLDVRGTASLSGNLTFDTAATIGTTKNNTLTIGGATSGMLILKSSNVTVFQNPGTSNIFVGESAGNVNLTGGNNAFFGVNAGLNNDASSNSFFGDNAGRSNSNGSLNSFFGRNSGYANNSGSSNSFFGYESGRYTTSGIRNAFFGDSAGYAGNFASENSALGYHAANSNLTGNGNVFIGFEAGESPITANANTSGNYNTFIGYESGPGSTTQLTNATAIGYQAVVNANNALVLGGTGSNAVRVGIGTATPSATLDLRGFATTALASISGRTSFAALNVDNSLGDLFTASSSGKTRMVLKNNGDFGVGTATPSSLLQVGNQGDGTVATANSWNGFSDIRFKDNIEPLRESLNKVLALEGVSFTWKNSGLPAIGFIAQEVEKVIPEIVNTDSNGFKSLDYGKITPLLVNAIHEQQNQISSLSAKMEKLETINFLPFSSIASDSSMITINDSLLVLGSTTTNDLSVANSLSVGNSLNITGNSINTIGETLEIQSLKQGNVSFMGGMITIDTYGNITTTGNITANNITATGVLSAQSVSIDSDDLPIYLSDTQVTASKSAGILTLKAGQSTLAITNPWVKKESLIFITPKENTEGQSMFVELQDTNTFNVSINSPLTKNILFNYVIINRN